MPRGIALALAVMGLTVLAGCASTGRWERVEVGMEADQVRDLMGTPCALDAGDDGRGLQGIWEYRNFCNTRRFEIIFRDGKVAEKHIESCTPW